MPRIGKNEAKRLVKSISPTVAVDTSTFKKSQTEGIYHTLKAHYKASGCTSLTLEIGMGTGEYIVEYAKRNPLIFCVGLEVKEERVVKAYQLAKKECLSNVFFICGYAQNLLGYLEEVKAQSIHINFPDPWPKKRHIKNRLTAPKFLDIYAKVLAANGIIEFKTDHANLFEYTVDTLSEQGWNIQTQRPLPHDESNILTRFEKRFREMGIMIGKITATR